MAGPAPRAQAGHDPIHRRPRRPRQRQRQIGGQTGDVLGALEQGAEIAVLHGNPAEEGQFVFRLKFPAGYEIPPHRHPKEEHVTVISGGFGMSTGETFERGATPILPAGSFMRIPVGQAHFAWTEEPTVVQLNGVGPFGVDYVNPEDDPRNN